MPGFSRDDQQLLAVIVGGHRRRVKAETVERLRGKSRRVLAAHLIVILRVAVLLNRGRSPEPLPRFEVEAGKRSLTLRMPQQWMDDNPLAAVDLAGEDKDLRGLEFSVRAEPLEAPDPAKSPTDG